MDQIDQMDHGNGGESYICLVYGERSCYACSFSGMGMYVQVVFSTPLVFVEVTIRMADQILDSNFLQSS